MLQVCGLVGSNLVLQLQRLSLSILLPILLGKKLFGFDILSHLNVLSPGATSLRSYNQSTICLMQNPEYHKRTKHIDIIFYKIQELHITGEIDL